MNKSVSSYEKISSNEKYDFSNISSMRKKYIIKLGFRTLMLVGIGILYFSDSDIFNVIEGWNFFGEFSTFHVIWGIWMLNMMIQLIPSRDYISYGSQKQFKKHYVETSNKYNWEKLNTYTKNNIEVAKKVFITWLALVAGIGILVSLDVLTSRELYLISAIFYVCDLICVVVWCPFRTYIMKNKCCVNCRIYNWDHIMMFSPLVFVKGFYTLSLFFVSLFVFLIWEFCVYKYPERFWEGSNETLRCHNCTDILCGKRINK